MKWRIYKEANEILQDTEEWDMFVVNIGWAGPEGYDDIEDWDAASRAWDKFIEDNDLPMCVGMKFPKGMDVDIKHLLEKQYGLPVENYDIDRSEGAMEFQTPWLEWTPEGWQEKDEVEFVSESNDVNIKKLLRQNGVTKLPSGMKFSDNKAKWEKHRGHAGKKTIYNMCVQLEHAGWKRGEWRTGGIPDGSAVSNANTYLSPDGQIVMEYYEHFGVTAYQNYYSITFKLAGTWVNESSRFGFNVGDEVELTSDVEPNRFSDRGVVPAGTVGEIVAVDKPMRGVIKVKIEDGTVVSVPERKLKFAGTDNEPWEKFKKPPEPPRNIKPERPEDYYMRPTSYGSPRYTGD